MQDSKGGSPEESQTARQEESPSSNAPAILVEDYAGAIIMGVLAVITFINVIIRYFTSQSFAWTEEISIFLMILLTLVGASSAFVKNHHIAIEYFALRARPKTNRALMQFARFMGMLMFGSLAILSARLVWDDFRFDETTPAIGIPQWWYSIWMPLLSLVIFIRLSIQAWRAGKAS